jgi:outer membrane protein assembly factor BamD (BamD/ComL family)
MPFQKGHKLAKGRPVGAINRSTEMMKLSIARATNKVLDDLPAIMEDIIKQDPKAAVDLAIKLLEFNLPKQSRVEMKAEIEQKIQ